MQDHDPIMLRDHALRNSVRDTCGAGMLYRGGLCFGPQAVAKKSLAEQEAVITGAAKLHERVEFALEVIEETKQVLAPHRAPTPSQPSQFDLSIPLQRLKRIIGLLTELELFRAGGGGSE